MFSKACAEGSASLTNIEFVASRTGNKVDDVVSLAIEVSEYGH